MDIDYIIQKLNSPFEMLNKIMNNADCNDLLSEYYNQYAQDSGIFKYESQADRVLHCYSSIIADRYKKRKVYNLKHINFCRNRFCPNCQKLIQATRLSNFSRVIIETSAEYDLYHIVFTVPNVTAAELQYTVGVLLEAFATLIGYFKGKTKIQGIKFGELGYYAALRSLEITYNTDRRDFHPHIHSIFALKKDLVFNKSVVNVFSYDYTNGAPKFERYFSEFEITLQKLWRLIVDGIRERDQRRQQNIKNTELIKAKMNMPQDYAAYREAVKAFTDISDIFTKPKRINARRITADKLTAMVKSDGYSVIMDRVDDGNFYEVFKYAFKIFSEDEKILTYEQFVTLLKTMESLRQVECYGGWRKLHLNDDIDELTKEELAELLVKLLEQEEKATEVEYLTVQDLIEVKKHGYAIISASKIMNMLREEFTTEEQAEFLEDARPLLEKVIRELSYKEIERKTWQEYGVANLNLNAPNKEDFARFKRKKQYEEILLELAKLFDLKISLLRDRQQQRDFINGNITERELRDKIYITVRKLQTLEEDRSSRLLEASSDISDVF